MKTLLIILTFALLQNYSYSQDCNSPNNLLVFNGSVGFAKGIMVPTAKLGIWRNVKPGGVTAFLGYQECIPFTQSFKDSTTRYLSSFFVEIGYKNRINPKLMWNLYAGSTKYNRYAGLQILYQASETVLVGCDYRNRIIGLSIITRFN